MIRKTISLNYYLTIYIHKNKFASIYLNRYYPMCKIGIASNIISSLIFSRKILQNYVYKCGIKSILNMCLFLHISIILIFTSFITFSVKKFEVMNSSNFSYKITYSHENDLTQLVNFQFFSL